MKLDASKITYRRDIEKEEHEAANQELIEAINNGSKFAIVFLDHLHNSEIQIHNSVCPDLGYALAVLPDNRALPVPILEDLIWEATRDGFKQEEIKNTPSDK